MVLTAALKQLAYAEVRDSRCRNCQDVFFDLAGQAFQGQPNGLLTHSVNLIQDQHGNDTERRKDSPLLPRI